ncbi:glycosyltransferase family 2 protein [Paenibacillus endoradicis]|uniref:glycosyltransferase family 2 protein n=1 Tax=Paenibacillus endoradicis TaxID=2972487 RepID=UPI0021595FC9|nr:glycosyltransferase family 2 protein [Paenibacillus endoradicis]MCR8656500.1 glycosyltransferase [Paenibacillus endoradicis]
MIKYSVVIPTYNNMVLLNNTLESLNDQLDFENNQYEVIVVDDGSSENTLNAIQDTPRTYSFQYIYLERTTDSCRARVRNIGWRKAQGVFVVFLDADMVVNRNYLSELSRYVDQHSDLIVISYRYMLKEPIAFEDIKLGRIFEKNYRTLDYFEARHFDSQQHSFNLATLKHPWHCVYSCNMALSKEKLELLGGFDERYKGWGMEDTDIGYRCYRLGMSIVSHLGIEALHQYHGEAFGDIKNQQKMYEWDKNITLMYEIHPYLHKELPRWRINFAYFARRVPKLLMRSERNRFEYRFDVRQEEEIPDLKVQIIELSTKPGNLIVIWDEVESVDLHLWIQLLGYTQSEIRYFPKSYMLEQAEIRQFFNKVFPLKKIIVLSYMCLKLIGKKFFRWATGFRLQLSKK